MEIIFSIILRTMLVVLLLESSKAIAIGTDFIFQNESITDEKTLVSSYGSFKLGFFNPGSSSSTNRYLGIWYNKIPVKTVVWVANRQKPVKGSSGALLINSTGQVMIMDENGCVVWSANQTKLAKQTSVLQLLDSGNLVLKDEIASDNYLWQSFDYPSDTLLPDMKLGWDSKTGVVRRITSWKSFDDPSLGDTSSGLEHSPYPEAIVWKGTQEFVRSGPWNGLSYSGSPELKSNSVYSISFVFNLDEAYYTYHLRNKSLISRIVAKQTNQVDRQVWIESEQKWITYLSVPKDLCDNYGLCGAYGNCIISESPVCQCLDGFKPKSAEKWNSVDWTEGCVRNKPLTCQDSDGFVEYFGLKLPDTRHTWVNKSMSLEECRVKCLENCSCMAYTNSDVRGLGSGCVMWLGDLVDIRQVSGGGQNLYIRMHVLKSEAKARKKIKVVAVVLVTTIGIVGAMVTVYCYVKKRKTKTKEDEEDIREKEEGNTKPKEDLELPIFNLATIADATDNFSPNRKLGEGGFGPVYMGNLADGREIAVKRLSKSSGQGLNEFKNEVILISKLQHRNLVKLLGCCIQEEEKLLVYEYMPNKSLDFIFDQKRAELLDWSKRFNIICGIARGLLYLHQDSRLRIIHRDLKASNVLLDHEMTPKISDFGLARIFSRDETEENTKRVVGTYGYMAPEYAINGLFSVKSDVFSFGILVMEVISGKKNRASYDHPNHNLNIIGQAWRLWNEGRTSDFVNECLVEEFCNISDQVARCVHISLLCVQRRAEDRPKMSSVILMLESEITLPQPQRPADFYVDKESISQNNQEISSTNELTLTLLEAR